MNNPSASVYQQIEAFGRAKYDFVDLTIEGPSLTLDIARVRKLLTHYGLSVVGHTDPCLPYAYPVQGVRDACFKELARCAKIFSALGANVMNIHPCYACAPCMKSLLLELNIEALRPIEKMARDRGLTLVLENYKAPFDRVSSYNTLLHEVPGLMVHLDFGHTNMGKDDGQTFCRLLGPAIKHVHFSDNRSTEDHHMPLGVGSVDWERAVAALKATGYDGTITLEVFCDDPSVLFHYLEISRKLVLNLWNR